MPKHPRILIVDDEPNVRLMLRTALATAGYPTAVAPDGETALGMIQAEPCDLIILDLRMPGLNGLQTLSRIRELGIDVPVMMLTAHGSIPDTVAVMRLGALDFLSKPITPAELRVRVAEVLERQHAVNRRPIKTTPAPSFGFELEMARRALNRGKNEEAEGLLRAVLAGSPGSREAKDLLDRLLARKEREARGAFPLLREWFPGGQAL